MSKSFAFKINNAKIHKNVMYSQNNLVIWGFADSQKEKPANN